MSINAMQWRAGFGIFYNCIKNMKKYIRSNLPLPNCLTYVSKFFHCLFNSLIFIDLKGGDVETSPGTNKKSSTYLTCYHWNVNSLIAHDFLKLTSSQGYNTLCKYDFICIIETYFDNPLEAENNISILGYSLTRADHPSNTKRSGVCIYCKESLAVRVVDIAYLSECVFCEATIQNKRGYITIV